MEYEEQARQKNKSTSLCCCDGGCCKGDGCGIKTGFWVALIVGTIALIGGSALVSIGLDHEAQANALDPQAEFTMLQEKCTVTSAEFAGSNQERCSKSSGKSSTSYDCGCTDTFFYRFDASQLANIEGFQGTGDNYVFSSMTFRRRRPNVQSCDDGSTPAYPTTVAGDELTCWRPTDPNQEIPWQYKCGTPTCIKVFDPQDDADAAKAISIAMWASGSFLLCLCAALCCGMIPCFIRIKKGFAKNDDLPMTASPNHEAPTNDYTAGNNNYSTPTTNNNSNYNAGNAPPTSSGPVTYYK